MWTWAIIVLMTTAAQVAANRINAAKSTGPQSSEGRARSSGNALKHGLRAGSLVLLPGESRADLESLLGELEKELLPVGVVEELLVVRIAGAQLRMERAGQFEVGTLESECAADVGVGHAAWRDANKGNALGLALRYLRAAETSMDRCLHELERRQAARRGSQVPVPTAVDVTVRGDLEVDDLDTED